MTHGGRDIMCCVNCGERDALIEYHMAGYAVNDDTYSNLPVSGGIDYPLEYIWCNGCDKETDIEPYEDWHERTTNEE